MSSRPGSPPSKPSSPTTGSVSTARVDSILGKYRHEQVVYALMTQLREKEAELNLLSEQRQVIERQHQIAKEGNEQLKSRIDVQNKAAVEKDTKIAVLEQKLAYEKEKGDQELAHEKEKGEQELAHEKEKGNASARAEAKKGGQLKRLTETHAECRRMLHERDDELSEVRPMLKDLKAKIEEFEIGEDAQLIAQLEEELAKIKEEFVIARDQNVTLNSMTEELEKKAKGKDWMFNSLKEESNEQRSRENHLLSHIMKLKEKTETYETKFKGKGIDVPLLLAKLKDFEVRTKELRSQVRRLTNEKLTELVVRSSSPSQDAICKDPSRTISRSQSEQDEVENESKASITTFSMEEEATYATNGTMDEIDNEFYAKSVHEEEDVLGDFLSDFKAGLETLEMESLCCGPEPPPDSMSSPVSPSGINPSSYESQLSPSSYSIRTFKSGSDSSSRSNL